MERKHTTTYTLNQGGIKQMETKQKDNPVYNKMVSELEAFKLLLKAGYCVCNIEVKDCDKCKD